MTLDDLVPLLDGVLSDEGVVLVRGIGATDGRRCEATILGGRLGRWQVRADGATLAQATADAIERYAAATPGEPIAKERTGPIAPSWSRFADVEATLRELAADGAEVTLKMDGQRRSGWFDVIVSGGKLGETSRRTSGESLLAVAEQARDLYARLMR